MRGSCSDCWVSTMERVPIMVAMTGCRIYVASLTDYNAGVLHGAWIDCGDADQMGEDVAAMLAESPTARREGLPAEEWAIHDYEGFGPWRLGEWESFERVAAVAELAGEHGGAFLAWLDNDPDGYDPDEWGDRFAEDYRGEWESWGEYVAEYVDGTGMLDGVPDEIARYFDFEAFGRDLGEGCWTAPAGGGCVYVFGR